VSKTLRIRTLVCNRCGHGSAPGKPWIPRQTMAPMSCPVCRTTLWRTPRRRKLAPDRLAEIVVGADVAQLA